MAFTFLVESTMNLKAERALTRGNLKPCRDDKCRLLDVVCYR